jgi:hypothetical protein
MHFSLGSLTEIFVVDCSFFVTSINDRRQVVFIKLKCY